MLYRRPRIRLGCASNDCARCPHGQHRLCRGGLRGVDWGSLIIGATGSVINAVKPGAVNDAIQKQIAQVLKDRAEAQARADKIREAELQVQLQQLQNQNANPGPGQTMNIAGMQVPTWGVFVGGAGLLLGGALLLGGKR